MPYDIHLEALSRRECSADRSNRLWDSCHMPLMGDDVASGVSKRTVRLAMGRISKVDGA